MPRNPNRYGGGSRTNRNGLHFEQTTSLNEALRNAGFEIRDYYDVYITFNLTAYSTTIDLKTRILNMFSAIFQQMKYNRTIYILLCLGFVNCLTTKILKNIWINIFILLSFIFLMIGVYIGGLPFIYYFLCFEAYIIFGFIFVLSSSGVY